MANTVIRVKTSTTTAIPVSLANGELAYSGNSTSNSLFIGLPDGSGITRIAGAQYAYLYQAGAPGVLTTNATPIVDSNGYIDGWKTYNFFLNGTMVTSINAVSNATTLGSASNSELTTTYAIKNYVDAKAASGAGAPGGTNTQIQFNQSGILGGSAALTFDYSAITLAIGNTSVNATINSTSFSGTANNATNSLNANNAANLGGIAANKYIQNTDSRSLSGNLTFTGANLVVSGTNTSISSNLTFTGANLNATSAVLKVRDVVISGNLSVTGTVTTIDATNLTVKDNIIILADQQANSTAFTDSVDTGITIPTGNTLTTYYSGLARIAAASTNTNPTFKLYSTTVAPNNTIIDTAAATGTLISYLTSGALVSNAASVGITANSTVNVNITANTLALSTPLNVSSGGLGLSTITSGGILVGNGTGNPTIISSVTDGNILQIVAGVPTFNQTISGGTF